MALLQEIYHGLDPLTQLRYSSKIAPHSLIPLKANSVKELSTTPKSRCRYLLRTCTRVNAF